MNIVALIAVFLLPFIISADDNVVWNHEYYSGRSLGASFSQPYNSIKASALCISTGFDKMRIIVKESDIILTYTINPSNKVVCFTSRSLSASYHFILQTDPIREYDVKFHYAAQATRIICYEPHHCSKSIHSNYATGFIANDGCIVYLSRNHTELSDMSRLCKIHASMRVFSSIGSAYYHKTVLSVFCIMSTLNRSNVTMQVTDKSAVDYMDPNNVVCYRPNEYPKAYSITFRSKYISKHAIRFDGNSRPGLVICDESDGCYVPVNTEFPDTRYGRVYRLVCMDDSDNDDDRECKAFGMENRLFTSTLSFPKINQR